MDAEGDVTEVERGTREDLAVTEDLVSHLRSGMEQELDPAPEVIREEGFDRREAVLAKDRSTSSLATRLRWPSSCAKRSSPVGVTVQAPRSQAEVEDGPDGLGRDPREELRDTLDLEWGMVCHVAAAVPRIVV